MESLSVRCLPMRSKSTGRKDANNNQKKSRPTFMQNIRGLFKTKLGKSKSYHGEEEESSQCLTVPALRKKSASSAQEISKDAWGQGGAREKTSELIETPGERQTKSSKLPNKLTSEPEQASSLCAPSKESPLYSREVFSYLLSYEQSLLVQDDFMKHQKYVTVDLRIAVVDWMMGIQTLSHYKSETLQIAISILDRTLQVHQVKKDKLQLMGTTALFIAAKYEETASPKISSFVFPVKDAYTAKQIRKMERYILSSIAFQIGPPNALEFVPYFYLESDADDLKKFANFLVEVSALECRMSCLPPSLIAFTALRTARRILGLDDETPDELSPHYRVYDNDDPRLANAASLFDELFRLVATSELKNIRKRINRYFPHILERVIAT